MSEQTFASPGPLHDGLPADSRFRKQVQAVCRLAYRYRWPLGAVGMLVVATIVMEWARARPGYDPYGWLVWGHLTLHWKLDTNGAPSWKPLPYLFTVPYALFGKHALQLWMITAFAFSLSGLVFAWRVAFWLVDAPPERRYAAYAAGLVAALAVLGIDVYMHSILSAESDTMIVALCLAAVDCIICRRYRWAFWAWWLAALGRPEVWAPMALYVIWAWRSVPAMRRQMIIGIVLIPVLWLGIPALTSKSPFSAASLAERSPRALHGNKITGTFDRFLSLNAAPVKLAALIATGFAVVRRDRPVLLLAGGVALWVIVEAAFALHGWPAVPRYMYEAAAGVCVLAGIFVGRVILDARSMLAWAHVHVSPRDRRLGRGRGGVDLRHLARPRRPRADHRRALRPDPAARPNRRDRRAGIGRQPPRRRQDPRLRTAEHRNRVAEHPGLGSGDQHRRPVLQSQGRGRGSQVDREHVPALLRLAVLPGQRHTELEPTGPLQGSDVQHVSDTSTGP